MHENMTIIFDSVTPAKGPIPKIKDPVTTGIITGTWFDDDTTEEEI